MKKAVVLLFIFFLTSCQKDENNIVINQDSFRAIKCYISKHNYQAYLLLSTKELFNDRKNCSGYLIGPFYRDILVDRGKTRLLEIDKKNVYILSDLSVFLRQYIAPQDDNTSDSTFLYMMGDNAIYTHDALVVYLKKSILLFYNNGKLYKNLRPDTLYLPKIQISEELHDAYKDNKY